MSFNSPKISGLTGSNVRAREVNDSLYELHTAVSVPTMQVIFFHGLPLGDFSEAHLSTWESGDGSCIWPQTWLVEKFSDSNIFSVSYSECLRKASVRSFDMFTLGENLISDLIGPLASCPIVFVGHCIGGLVIKQLCLQVHDKLHMASTSEKAKLGTFLDNVRGIFYYATPHHGSPDLAKVAETMGSPLSEYVKILSAEAERMNTRFAQLHRLHPKWKIHGLGESMKTKLGRYKEVLLVPEASSRTGEFRVLPEDHYSICKPEKKTSTSFTALVKLLDNIMSTWKEEIKEPDEKRKQEEARAHAEAQPRNLQHLPKEVVGVESRLEEVKSMLEDVTTVGLLGMGGVGKTTLANAVFNKLSLKFDYSCFVPDVKSIKGTEYQAKEAMWKHMHYKGRMVGNEADWSTLKGKRLLLVLDDIAEDRDINILSDLAEYCSSESKYIATSRDQGLLKQLEVSGEVYEVPFLDKSDSEELFRSHAFPNGAIIPLNLANVMVDVVKKCAGLPLALRVLGRYLVKKEYTHWEQVLRALDKGEAVTAHEKLWAVLRYSYDGLQETEKKMFLDTTTFFSNGQFMLGEAKAIWRKAYKTECETLWWQTLVDRCLVNDVEDNERIQMHEQLQSLGRMIVSQCNKDGNCRLWECNKHGPRRVWEEQIALELLQTPGEVNDKEFHSLQIERSFRGKKDVIRIANLALHNLKKLRFLNINAAVVVDGSEEGDSSLHELLVLNCVGLHIFNLAIQNRLVVLKLSVPGVEELPASIGQLSSLQVFVLSNATKLSSLPEEIGLLAQLETFKLRFCGSLQHLPKTFGQLFKLKHLEFVECRSLCALPEEFGDLKALIKLTFDCCKELKTLPERFGNLLTLRELHFTSCCLENLPMPFGKLSTLMKLELIDCENMWSLIPFGQLKKLEYLKIGGEYKLGEMDSMPDSVAKLSALSHLIIDTVSTKSIPDYINLKMPSLHTLELSRLPYVEVLPAWLGNVGKIPLALSRKIFEKQGGCFRLTDEEDAITARSMVKLLHSNAMNKVKKADYRGALEDLCPANLKEMKPKWEGFLLQERGILKRLIGDLPGALKDLSAALEFLSEANDLHHYAYECYKHRGFVNFSLKNPVEAQIDGTMALQILSRCGFRSLISASLGDESAAYMHFRLKGLREIMDEQEDSTHSQVMEWVRAEDFPTALATWNAFDARVSGYYNRVYFLQERGILKRMAGDLHGALEDLTAALEIDEDDYECLKHQGYVKHLLGDDSGARIAAGRILERSKAMERENHGNESLGARSVKFLGFHLT